MTHIEITKPKRGLADTPAGQLHYRVCGDGPPLVLLHMTNLSSRGFAGLMPLLAGFRTYAVDLPGFGYSDALEGRPDIRAFAQSVVHFMDAVGIAKAHVFGMHAGNKIGAMLAACWPERVERFILAGMTHSLITDQSKRLAAVRDHAHKLRESQKAADPGLDLEDWALLFSKVTSLWWRPKVIAKPSVTAADLRRLEDEVFDLLHGRRGYGAFYLASWVIDMAGILPQIAAPTLVIELATPGEAHLGPQAPVLEKLLPNCRSVTIEMDGTDLLYEQPALLARHINEFLNR